MELCEATMERITAIQAIFLGGPATIDVGHEPQFAERTDDNEQSKTDDETTKQPDEKGRETERQEAKKLDKI